MRRASLILLIVLAFGSLAEAGVYLTIVRRSDPGPSARKSAAIDAKREIDAAQNDVRLAYAHAMRNHPLAGEIQAAQRELAKANRDLTAARNKVKAQLAEMPEVRKLLHEVRLIDERIVGEKDTAMRTQLANERLAIRKRLSAIESEAMGADVYVTLGVTGVMDANKILRSLQDQYRGLLIQDPNFAQAKARLDAAHQRMAQLSR